MPDKLLSADPKAGVLLSADPSAGLAASASAPSSGGGTLTAALISHLTPYVEHALMEFATNPNAAKTGGAIGRAIGAVAPTAAALSNGDPMGVATGVALSGKTSWAGGKAGWFTTKLAQNLSAHIAKIAEEAEPYISKLQPAIATKAVSDLAQLAEPDRKDIGTFGIGASVSDSELMTGLIQKRGMTPQQAAMTIAKGDGKKLSLLMNDYLRARK